ncbi:conserved hypothetical protein [Candidatus Sulfobium mesophilum]|uniref:Uncharacterized protein n=1 Tax=Candidatus Sulfobium mesophilum TaxID=2016548 RepID=A0A2U3QGE8_9BACT|nr:conserved hypothetical protein [Candidatus Sulfobium mesophilum]
MLITVVYQDGKQDLVDPLVLKKLLASDKVKRFLRSDGWAIVGRSPMRGDDKRYKSYNVERRHGSK